MMIVGSVSNETEKEELEFITKIFLIGQRIREVSQEWRIKNENNNKKQSK